MSADGSLASNLSRLMQEEKIDEVRLFWEANPLFAEESNFPTGSREFFEEHSLVYERDCFAGQIDPRIFPNDSNKERVLDLGCGPGFWTIELSRKGAKTIIAADLTRNAISLTQKRANIYGVEIETSLQNAERMSFEDGSFSHVNCQGVIHHTPNTEACVGEIARVLRPGGTSLISVYYKHLFLRSWPILKYPARVLLALGAGMKGRGRENIYGVSDINEIVRLYDGEHNPIGKAYSKSEFGQMLSRHFEIEEIFFHFFPARSLPFRIPGWLHRILDERFGFMIFAKCRKPGDACYRSNDQSSKSDYPSLQ